MMKTSCPPVDCLGTYVRGMMNPLEMRELEQHLQECQACCEKAETLHPADEVTKAFGAPSQDTEADAELLEGVIQRVLRLRASVEQTTSRLSSAPLAELEQQTLLGDDPTSLLSPPQRADELGRLGDYRVLKVIGRGGMGVVFLAEDERLRRRIALKVMRPEALGKHGAKDRFLREARAAAAVSHDNVVTIHQVGEDRGCPFIAMPLLEGESLKTMLIRETRLPQASAVGICRQIAAGLAAAHQTGLIHRDIKPDNLWVVSPHHRVKILDFGLVRDSEGDSGLTKQGAVLGTPSYMSPEQAYGEAVDHRSDLFSLGAVLYQMLSGRSPYAGSTLTATLLNVARAQAPPIQTLVQGLDPELITLVHKLNAKDPAERPQTAEDVVQTLVRIESRLASQGFADRADRRQNSAADASSAQQPKRRTWHWVLFAGALGATVLAITIFVQLGKHNVRITLDDPAIALKIDGETLVIEDGEKIIRLSAGPHQVSVTRDGFATITDAFTVEKNGKNTIHVSIVRGRLAVLEDGPQAIVEASDAVPTREPLVVPAESAASNAEQRAALWMRSQEPPLVFRLMSTRDSNRQWEFLPESTEPLPQEPYFVYELSIDPPYLEKVQDAAADDIAPHVTGLKGLNALRMGGDYITDKGIAKLLAIPEFTKVSQIQLSGSELTDELFPMLASLKELTQIHFANVPRMDGIGIGELSACPKLRAVAWTIASPQAKSMEELSRLPDLRSLEMNAIQCTLAHVNAIAKLNLRNLYLYNSGLDDEMVKQLSVMTDLEHLNVSYGKMTDIALTSLQKLRRLKSLDIRQTLVTRAGIDQFQQAVPDCQVHTDLP